MTDGEIVRLTLSYTIANSSIAQNVFYYLFSGTDESDAAVFDALQTWAADVWGDEWDNQASIDAVLDQVKGEVITVAGTIVRVIGEATLNIIGDGLGDVLPAAVALLISAATVVPAVSGKKYVPGFGEGVVEDGAFTSAFLSAIATLATSYITSLIVTAFESSLIPGVISSKVNTFVPFGETTVINDIPAYQRRRKPNVGI